MRCLTDILCVALFVGLTVAICALVGDIISGERVSTVPVPVPLYVQRLNHELVHEYKLPYGQTAASLVSFLNRHSRNSVYYHVREPVAEGLSVYVSILEENRLYEVFDEHQMEESGARAIIGILIKPYKECIDGERTQLMEQALRERFPDVVSIGFVCYWNPMGDEKRSFMETPFTIERLSQMDQQYRSLEFQKSEQERSRDRLLEMTQKFEQERHQVKLCEKDLQNQRLTGGRETLRKEEQNRDRIMELERQLREVKQKKEKESLYQERQIRYMKQKDRHHRGRDCITGAVLIVTFVYIFLFMQKNDKATGVTTETDLQKQLEEKTKELSILQEELNSEVGDMIKMGPHYDGWTEIAAQEMADGSVISEQMVDQEMVRYAKIPCSVSESDIRYKIIPNGVIVTSSQESGVDDFRNKVSGITPNALIEGVEELSPLSQAPKKIQFRFSEGFFEFKEDETRFADGYLMLVFRQATWQSLPLRLSAGTDDDDVEDDDDDDGWEVIEEIIENHDAEDSTEVCGSELSTEDSSKDHGTEDST